MIDGRVIGWVEDSQSDGYPVWSSWNAYQRAIYFLNSDGVVDTTFNFTPYNENQQNYDFIYNLIMELRDDDGTTLIIDYLTGWNMVGLPVIVNDSFYESLFPNSVPGTLYSFYGTYEQEENLNNGKGYWLRFESSSTNNFSGNTITELELSLNEGWNIISGLTFPISIINIMDSEGIIIPGTVYGFNETYQSEDLLYPGKGYWIKTISSGMITLVAE